MIGRRLTRLPVAAAFAAELLGASAAFVLGYFAAGGFGVGSVAAATLNAPTGVVAAHPDPASRTVHVTWSGRPAPDGSTPTGFYVERVNGGIPSPACGSSPAVLLPGTAGGCDDTGVASGTYAYVVTSVFRSWTATSSPGVTVTVPEPQLDHFVVTPTPTSVTAGSPVVLSVTAIDQYGDLLAAYAGAQCVTLAGPSASPGGTRPSYPGAGTCAAGSSVTFTSGSATVALTLVAAETTTITVTDTAMGASGTSDPVTVGPAAAARLVFTQQPSATATAGAAFARQPEVTLLDAFGNTATSSTGAVTLASAGSGLACTTSPVDAVAGVATFTGCAMTAAGSWQLTATGTGLASGTSDPVTVGPAAAARLVFTQQPSGAVQNNVFPTQPRVGFTDAYGNPVTSASASITLAITPGTGSAGAVLTCTTNPVATVSGVATFAGCRINLVGTNYRLRATGGGYTLADSSQFNIGNGTSTTTVVASGAPQAATVNTAFVFPLVARVMDAYGSPVPGVTVTFTSPASGASGRFPGGSATATASTDASGLATAPAFTANTLAGNYAVVASAPGTTTASFLLTNNPAAASRLAFTTQPPATTVAGITFATQPVVTVQDVFGNTVTIDTSAVTIAVTGGTAPITCTSNPATAVAGVAVFAGCTVTRAGTGYTLTATGGTLTAATSNAFTITAATATTLAASSGSGQSATVNTSFAGRLVALATDAYGNPVSGVTVTFTASADPGAAFGGSATATATTNAAGLATSAVITADTTAGSYSVPASAPGTTSATFDLTNTPGTATQLLFQDDPSSAFPNVAFGTQPTVVIADSYGNTVPTATATVALAITAGTGTAGAILTCAANPLATVSGVAPFTGCSIDLGGLGYTITATGGGYTAAVSAPFDITAQLRPASLALTNGAGLSRGQMEAGDRMVIRYSGTLKASTMCSDWTDDTTAYTVADATITLTGRGAPSRNDQVTVSTSTSCAGAFNLGYIDLGTTRASGNSTTIYSWNATVAWDPASGTLTVTIGSRTSASTPAKVKPNVSARYYPSATLTDPQATPITGTALHARKLF